MHCATYGLESMWKAFSVYRFFCFSVVEFLLTNVQFNFTILALRKLHQF